MIAQYRMWWKRIGLAYRGQFDLAKLGEMRQKTYNLVYLELQLNSRVEEANNGQMFPP